MPDAGTLSSARPRAKRRVAGLAQTRQRLSILGRVKSTSNTRSWIASRRAAARSRCIRCELARTASGLARLRVGASVSLTSPKTTAPDDRRVRGPGLP